MAQQHSLGHLVPLKVKSEKRESNHPTTQTTRAENENAAQVGSFGLYSS